VNVHQPQRDQSPDQLHLRVQVQLRVLVAAHDPDLSQALLALPHPTQDTAHRTAPFFWGDDVFEQRHPTTEGGAASIPTKSRTPSRRLYGRTKPGSLLKHHIPIQTDHWDVTGPGFTEIDLVSHSGDCAEGEFAHSFNLTDIHTAWTETRAVRGKGQSGLVTALEEMRQALPFALRGIDSDNGSEFLNAHLVRYCQAQSVQFTRGRPYKKDDNAHIEQKNWTHVRKLIGWDRYDSPTAVDQLNDLYRHELPRMMNWCQPSVKLLRKERVGSRLRRVYDRPQTPLERLQACPGADPAIVAKLLRLRAATDPFQLAQTIERKLERIYDLASHRDRADRVTSQTA
jgi:hypothetical protein